MAMLEEALRITASSMSEKPVEPITRAGPSLAMHSAANSAEAAPIVKSMITSQASMAAARATKPSPDASGRSKRAASSNSGRAWTTRATAWPMWPRAPATPILIRACVMAMVPS